MDLLHRELKLNRGHQLQQSLFEVSTVRKMGRRDLRRTGRRCQAPVVDHRLERVVVHAGRW
jgi:hypothetical protein